MWPLLKRLPAGNSPASGDSGSADVLDRFLEYVREKDLTLYPAQEEALLELYSGKNVILNTPTGSGKSLVATGLHFLSLAQGRRSIYTCPIKALVNEKFLALCRDFGPEQVGMITGDASVNPSAPILCCTAEILAIDALRAGREAPLDDIIMDEFHYYSDRERGVAWQIPLLVLSRARFLLMSATLGDTAFFERSLTELNGRETVNVYSATRPVPLDFIYSENPVHETVAKLVAESRAPIYLVSFTQRGCAEEAQNFMSIDLCTKDEKRAISAALEGFKFSSPYGKEMQKFIKHGLGLHHAGLLPKYRVLVERLAQRGLLKIIFGTDTLGVGVNIPIRTVLLTKLCKFDGEKTAILSVRDFQQISGRAGRRGFDDRGTVVVQAPEHVIENIRMEQKACGDPKKIRKLVKRKPPEKGFVSWNRETFDRLVNGQPEPLVSRFKVTHAMLLHVLGRARGAENPGENPCRAFRSIIRNSHETPHAKKQHGRKAFELFRSLVDRKLIELNPLRVNVDLQDDFSLNQALSLYLIDTIKLLDRDHETYALDLLTLVESILENPELILRKQLDRLKTERMAQMRLDGLEYEERIEELEKLEYPKPNRDFIYETFNRFASDHPWVGQDNIRPKSIGREMYEMFCGFAEYIREYDLHRGEGILLRYLFDLYKALVQTVPSYAKNEEIEAMEMYFGAMVRNVDSSLFDEWQRMRGGTEPSPDHAGGDPAADETDAHELFPDPQRNSRAFRILLRNEIFRLVRALSVRDYETAASLFAQEGEGQSGSSGREGSAPTAAELEKIMEEYYQEHSRIRTDTQGRAPKHLHLREGEPGSHLIRVQQVLVDMDEHNDWVLELVVDLAASRQALRPIFIFERIGAVL